MSNTIEIVHDPDNPLASFVPYHEGHPLVQIPTNIETCSQIMKANPGKAIKLHHAPTLHQYPFPQQEVKSWL